MLPDFLIVFPADSDSPLSPSSIESLGLNLLPRRFDPFSGVPSPLFALESEDRFSDDFDLSIFSVINRGFY